MKYIKNIVVTKCDFCDCFFHNIDTLWFFKSQISQQFTKLNADYKGDTSVFCECERQIYLF